MKKVIELEIYDAYSSEVVERVYYSSIDVLFSKAELERIETKYASIAADLFGILTCNIKLRDKSKFESLTEEEIYRGELRYMNANEDSPMECLYLSVYERVVR